MNKRALTRIIREVVLRDADVARDTADVDDGSGVALVPLCGLLEEGQEGGAHEEGTDYVGLIRVQPLFL